MTSTPKGPAPQPPWAELRRQAREVVSRAYVPYSSYPVGAAAQVDDGRTVVGCNVENASYGVALCAECGLVSALFASGGGRLTAFTCCDGEGRVIMPCGRCRQLLWEHGGPQLLVDCAAGPRPLSELLPEAFGPADLLRSSGARPDPLQPDPPRADSPRPDPPQPG